VKQSFVQFLPLCASRSIAIVSCPSICLTLRYFGHISWVTSKVIIWIISLRSSLLGAPTSQKTCNIAETGQDRTKVTTDD